MQRILVIDDDTELCELLGDYLGREGFAVDAIHDGEGGVAPALSGDFALVILDVMLPGCSGFETLRTIRQTSKVPVLMLTACQEDVDRIVGLEMGADDYLPKPFNPRELVARIKAVLRRSTAWAPSQTPVPAATADPNRLAVDDLVLDVELRTVSLGGAAVSLTSIEFGLLELLVRSAGHVVKRQELSAKVLGRNLTRFDRSIDVHVSNVRKKLGAPPGRSERIRTLRGVGYLYLTAEA